MINICYTLNDEDYRKEVTWNGLDDYRLSTGVPFDIHSITNLKPTQHRIPL